MTSSHALTDAQLVLLSQASQHPEGKIVPPVHLRGVAFRRVMASLAGKGLVQSAPVSAAGRDQLDDDLVEASSVISSAGLAALGIVTEGEGVAAIEPTAPDNHPALGSDLETRAGSHPASDLAPSGFVLPEPSGDVPASLSPQHPRAGSKQAHVLELLAHPEGVTLDALMAATGWLPHTTRAVLSGLRKRGHAIERVSGDGEGGSRYRLVTPACEATAPDPSAAAPDSSAPEHAA